MFLKICIFVKKLIMTNIKHITLIFSFIFILSSISFSITETLVILPVDTPNTQHNYLTIITKQNNKEILACAVGDKIIIWTRGLKFKGKIKAISSDKIYIDNFPVIYIKDIVKIKHKTIFYAVAGLFLMYGGSLITMAGGVIIFLEPTAFIAGIITISVGTGLFLIGLDTFKGKNYKLIDYKFESNYSKTLTNQEIYFIDE